MSLQGFSTQMRLIILAIMGALSIKGTPKLVQVIANGKFSYDQAKAALEGFQRGYEAYKNGDALTATKEWTAAPVNAFFAVMTGKHAVEGGLELRKTAVPAIKQAAGDVRDALNQAHESVMRSGEPRNDSPYAIVGHDAETGLPIMRRIVITAGIVAGHCWASVQASQPRAGLMMRPATLCSRSDRST